MTLRFRVRVVFLLSGCAKQDKTHTHNEDSDALAPQTNQTYQLQAEVALLACIAGCLACQSGPVMLVVVVVIALRCCLDHNLSGGSWHGKCMRELPS